MMLVEDSLALVVQQTQETAGLGLYECQTRCVVQEVYVLPPNALLAVLLLLVLEHVLVEVVLQMFVGVVDAQLLKTKQKQPVTTTPLILYSYCHTFELRSSGQLNCHKSAIIDLVPI